MATDILRDFLVRLGFKVDDGSMKQFQRSVDVVTSQVAALALQVEAVTASMAVAVEKWSKGFEDLFYASQRTGASAKSLKAFEYALSQVGGTAEGAHSAVENLARFMRNNPGAEAWLKSNGVATRDAAGKMLDTVEILKNFGKQLRSQPNYRANVLAQVIGLDEQTRQAMNRDFESFEREYEGKLKRFGLNAEEAAKRAQETQQRIRSLGADLSIVSDMGLAAMARGVEELIDWFRNLNPSVQTAIEVIGGLAVASAALNAVWRATPIGALLAAGTALAGLWADYQSFKKTGKSELPWAEWEPTLRAIGETADWATKKIQDFTTAALGWWDKHSQASVGSQLWEGARNLVLGTDGNRSSRAASAMAYFMGQGWTRAQAAGLASNMDAESKGDPTAVGDSGTAFGIFQWHPDRQAEFRRAFGKPIQQASFEEQLAFKQYELTQGAERRAGMMLRAAQNAYDAGAIESTADQRPLNVAVEAAKRGAAAVALNNNTTINVHGSGDPHATAGAVAAAQDGVNERHARNLATQVQ